MIRRRRCRELRPGLSRRLDDDLGAGEAAALDAHLERCPDCARFAAELAALVRVLRAAGGPGFSGIRGSRAPAAPR